MQELENSLISTIKELQLAERDFERFKMNDDFRFQRYLYPFFVEIWNNNSNDENGQKEELIYEENISQFLGIIQPSDNPEFINFSAKIAFNVTIASFRTLEAQNEFYEYIFKLIKDSMFNNFESTFIMFFRTNKEGVAYNDEAYKDYCDTLRRIDANFLSSTRAFKQNNNHSAAKLIQVT